MASELRQDIGGGILAGREKIQGNREKKEILREALWEMLRKMKEEASWD